MTDALLTTGDDRVDFVVQAIIDLLGGDNWSADWVFFQTASQALDDWTAVRETHRD